jgi:hypothetical protein
MVPIFALIVLILEKYVLVQIRATMTVNMVLVANQMAQAGNAKRLERMAVLVQRI